MEDGVKIKMPVIRMRRSMVRKTERVGKEEKEKEVEVGRRVAPHAETGATRSRGSHLYSASTTFFRRQLSLPVHPSPPQNGLFSGSVNTCLSFVTDVILA